MPMSLWLNQQLELIYKTKGIKKAKHQHELGLWYEQGLHKRSERPELDGRPDLAIIWYKKAAKNGCPEAQYKLAIAYEKGGYGLDIRLAVTWYEKSSEKGHLESKRALPEAQYKLANAYEYGRDGFEKNLRLAVLYYQHAAKNGSIEAQSRLPSAYYELAVIYQHGTYGIEKNIDHAIYYYKLASEKGISQASYHLACIYKDRVGIRLEEQGHAIQEALYYFKKASFQGDQAAASKIEQIYTEGLAQRPEPPKPVVKPSSVPEGFNRQNRRKPHTIIQQKDGTLALMGRVTTLQVEEHQPSTEMIALTPCFDLQRSTESHFPYGQMRGSKTSLVLRTYPQNENKQENRPLVRGKLPLIPVF